MLHQKGPGTDTLGSIYFYVLLVSTSTSYLHVCTLRDLPPCIAYP